MAEILHNRTRTTVDTSYTAGSGTLNVDDASDITPVTTVGIFDQSTKALKALLNVTSKATNALTVSAEGGIDANANGGDIVAVVVSKRALEAVLAQMSQAGDFASLPSVTGQLTGAIYRQTDGPYEWRLEGGVWVPFLPGSGQMVLPPSGSWSWGTTQGSATEDQSDGSLTVQEIGTGGAIRIYDRAAGSTFDVTAMVELLLHNTDYATCGISIRESGTGKFRTLGLNRSSGGGGMYWATQQYTNSTTTTGETQLAVQPYFEVAELRWVLDSTNITAYIRGRSRGAWIQVFQQAKAAFFTAAPDRAGLFVGTFTSGAFARVRALSFDLQ